MFANLGAFADTLRLEVGLGESSVRRLVAALVIGLVGAALSGVLLMQHHGEPSAVSAVNQACGDGQTSGCEEVARSPHSKVAGVPLAALGLGGWAVTTLAVAAGVLAADAALAARAAQRAATMLGLPAPAPASSPTAVPVALPVATGPPPTPAPVATPTAGSTGELQYYKD